MVPPSHAIEGTIPAEVPVFPYIHEGDNFPCPDPVTKNDPYPSKDLENIRKVEVLLRELDRNGIEIPNTVAIREYLYKYEDMVDLVERVSIYTRWFFPSGTELSLEVYHDPEVDDEHLSLYVRQCPYDKNLMTTLKAITATYLDELAFKSGWLSVTTDFRFPRYQHAV